ncbi:MAG: LysR family transcriptional regulator [Eubacteriales bacterium]|nr:LysR family transcriptional regulator [Eubacteriales bacterium]
MINHLNLVYFITAARELNFTKAAEKLYISQQALSNHIASLEKEVGLTLIDRKAPMKLTYAGEIFYKYAVQMEDSYHAMMQELSDVREEKRGELTVGISHTRGRLILPKVLPVFMKAYPLMEVHVLEGNTEELTRALQDGTVDMAVGPCLQENPEMVYTGLMTEEVVLAVSEELFARYGEEEQRSMKAELSETGKITCLKHIPFLLNKKGNISRDIADTIFQEEGMKPHTLIETENIETVGEMCAGGIGAAFYPTSLLQTVMMDDGLGELQLFGLSYPCTHMEISVVYRKNRYLTAAMKEMIRIMREVIK